ncbi:JAB domain-containing protein, partial [Anaerosporobacter sp.]
QYNLQCGLLPNVQVIALFLCLERGNFMTDDQQEQFSNFEEVIRKMEENREDKEYFEVSVVETRLHSKRGRRYQVERFSTPEKAAILGKKLLPRYLDRECVYVVGLTTKMEPISIQLMSIGSMNSANLDSARILTHLLISGAQSFVIYHNHISGDTTPSNEDIVSTKRIRDAANLVGLNLADHIIIGEGFCSMKEKGYI